MAVKYTSGQLQNISPSGSLKILVEIQQFPGYFVRELLCTEKLPRKARRSFNYFDHIS